MSDTVYLTKIRERLHNGVRDFTDGDMRWLLTQYDALAARMALLEAEHEAAIECINGRDKGYVYWRNAVAAVDSQEGKE